MNGDYERNFNLKNFLKNILNGGTIGLDIDVLCMIGEDTLKFYSSFVQETIPSSKVIYMRRTGKYGIENYKLMDTFKKWIKENNLYNEDSVIYAIPMDNPEIVEPFRCRYDVCIAQPSNQNFSLDQIMCRELEGGNYLIFLIPHTAQAVQVAWNMCFSELKKLGYSLDKDRPIMERYKKTLVDKHCCELCVPVQ